MLTTAHPRGNANQTREAPPHPCQKGQKWKHTHRHRRGCGRRGAHGHSRQKREPEQPLWQVHGGSRHGKDRGHKLPDVRDQASTQEGGNAHLQRHVHPTSGQRPLNTRSGSSPSVPDRRAVTGNAGSAHNGTGRSLARRQSRCGRTDGPRERDTKRSEAAQKHCMQPAAVGPRSREPSGSCRAAGRRGRSQGPVLVTPGEKGLGSSTRPGPTPALQGRTLAALPACYCR